jgi:hypothetical protein
MEREREFYGLMPEQIDAGDFRHEAGYDFFPDSSLRRELVELSDKFVGYVHDNSIKNVVLVDRAVRCAYIGLKEMWRRKYPEERGPDTYFINPDGLFSVEEDELSEYASLSPELVYSFNNSVIQDAEEDFKNPFELLRSEKGVRKDFESTYTRLVTNKDKPTLVFDTCIHSGNTFRLINSRLADFGFTRLQTGVVSDQENYSGMQPDFIGIRGTFYAACFPFQHDGMVLKPFNSVTSYFNPFVGERRRSASLRKELFRIFRESE